MKRRRFQTVAVLGGGTNGLAAATVLARTGRRVTVFERAEDFGGLARGTEFHPGFRTSGILHATAGLRPSVVRALDLTRHGLEFQEREPARLLLERDGPGLVLERDPERAHDLIAARSEKDATAYASWRAFLARVGGFVASVMTDPAPDLDPAHKTQLLELVKKGVQLRRLGETDMLELIRIAPMAVADWMKDSFETPLLRAGLAAPALHGTWLGPWSAGSAANLLVREATHQRTAKGGPAAVARALTNAARAAGVELRTDAHVGSITVEREGGTNSVRAIVLADGSSHACDAVLSTLEPKHTLLDLVPHGALPPEVTQIIANWRTRGTTAKVHLALDGSLPLPGSHTGPPFEHLATGSDLDELERAFDTVKYGALSETPVLDVHVPSLSDPRLAPEGRHVVSMLVHYAPYSIAGGWDDALRSTLEERALAVLEAHCPGVENHILATQTLSPADLEEHYGLPGGHVHHGEHALDQLLFLRPAQGLGHCRTPLSGLFLGGSGTHPGGGITCAPGVIAAKVLTAG